MGLLVREILGTKTSPGKTPRSCMGLLVRELLARNSSQDFRLPLLRIRIRVIKLCIIAAQTLLHLYKLGFSLFLKYELS